MRRLQSLSSVVTAGALHCYKVVSVLQSLSSIDTTRALHCLKVVSVLQSFFNIVTAWANGRLLEGGEHSSKFI